LIVMPEKARRIAIVNLKDELIVEEKKRLR
jgi:hypothetical protein